MLSKFNQVDNFSFLNAAHAGYFSDLYDQYLKDPDSLEPSWKAFFQGYDFANSDFLKDEILDGISPSLAQTFNIELTEKIKENLPPSLGFEKETTQIRKGTTSLCR